MSKRKPITLNISFDGTWLSKKDERPSNVQKYHKSLSGYKQKALYLPGVGAGPSTTIFSKLFGGVGGFGVHGRRDTAYKWLKKHWRPGDRICIVAFSRGCVSGRGLAFKISEEGINGHDVDIDFLGCWDTVGAMGIPIDIGIPFTPFKIPFQKINLFTNLEVGKNVKCAVHIVALDEDREAFLPSLMNARDGIDEVWMIGVHSDVGGGEPDSGLSDIALEYMAKRAEKAGIKFKMTAIKALKPSHNGTIHTHKINPKPGVRTVDVLIDDEPSDLLPYVHLSASLRKDYTPKAKIDMGTVKLVR